jgi:hypothetical protein
MADLERRKDTIRNQLRQAIGTASYGELPEAVGGKSAWKWSISANGARPLLAVKSAGAGTSKARNLLEAPVQLHALPEAELISKYRTTRRAARR